ncbi:MAG: hypothetical protein HY722_04110 [Planctomycetes bacterium]|nr:hypothetical protein [Planctomycetota bacterium]
MKGAFWVGVLLGMNLVWAVLLASAGSGAGLLPPSMAQTADSSGGYVAATASQQGGGGDVLFVVDTAARRLAVYEFRNRNLSLRGVRNFKYDMDLNDVPVTEGNGPRVSDVKKSVEKGE